MKTNSSKTDRNINKTQESKHSKKKERNDSEKKSKKRKKESTNTEDDEDVEVTRQKSKPKKTQRIIVSDSDEEEPIPRKNRKNKGPVINLEDSDEEVTMLKKISSLDKFVKVTPPKSKVKTPEKKTPVSACAFFGNVSVQRSEKKVAAKRKIVPVNKVEVIVANEFHADDDFAATLSLLDDVQPSKKIKKDDNVKEESKPSLASKLASQVHTLVADTPKKETKSSKCLVPDTPTDIKKKSPLRKPSSKKSLPKSVIVITPTKTPKKTENSTPTGKGPSPKKSGNSLPTDKGLSSKDIAAVTPNLINRASYRAYLHREGPAALGSKDMPEGAENCLEGLTFVITGVLDSIERHEAKSLVEKYGGKVTASLSKNTSYIVVGCDAGVSKLNKAEQLKTVQLNEDSLFELIRTLPGKISKYLVKAEEEAKRTADELKKAEKSRKKFQKFKSEENNNVSKKILSSKSEACTSPVKSSQSGESLLWVDKYKPTSTKTIIGQQGDKSNAKKLANWLKNWHHNRAVGTKTQSKFFGKDDGGGGLRAALLSGPPGVGKTTTATLVCQEAKFSFIELNASDTRSKKSLKHVVAESLDNTTLVDFMGPNKSGTSGQKHCIIMDEVDGMAGNEDRGGIQELVLLIKQTKIPIICICNDRNHQKMRTLANYCYDLRFYRPRVEQIKGAMMSLIYKEGLKIPPPALNEIIQGANQDVRQIIHNLYVWSSTDKGLTYEQAKEDAQKAKKDLKISPFEVCRKVFVGGDETTSMSLNDKSDLFFQDYSFMPLFVQENYIVVNPYSARGSVARHLSALSRAADSIADGDLVDKKIRSEQNWGLLPIQAIYSSVIPGEVMRGGFTQMVQFPSWLGRNSSRNKIDRVLQELRVHMRLQISGDLKSLNMDYLPMMRRAMTEPLVQRGAGGAAEAIQFMDEYDIIKDDFDNILEISKWPNSIDPLSKLDAKTKGAFTRAYNKEAHITPYVTGTMTKKRRGKAQIDIDDLMTGEDRAAMAAESSEEEEDLSIIKKGSSDKGKKVAAKSESNIKGSSKSRGKGKNRT